MITALPTTFDLLTSELRIARIRLINARDAYQHSPNADRQARLDTAQSFMDALLDECLIGEVN